LSLFGGVEIPGRPDLSNIAILDRLPVPQIRRMERYGIEIIPDHFHDLTARFDREMIELEKDIASYIPPANLHDFTTCATAVEEEGGDASINAASAEQIGKLLFGILGVGREKNLKKTKAGDRLSTGKKQLELIQLDHPVVRKILDYRERAKLKSTYSVPLPRLAKWHPHGPDCPVCHLSHKRPSWRIHTQIPTTRAETGRLASRRPNLMNIPARTELGGLIRMGFVAGEGNKLVSTDLSQIELRDMAHCANAESMKKVYREGLDIHMFTACAAFGLDLKKYTHMLSMEKRKESFTPEQKKDWADFKLTKRLPSKNLNFMIAYGATVMGLLAQLALSGLIWSEDEGNRFIDRWFNLYPEVREYMDLQHYRARRYGMVWDLFGRIRLTPEAKSCHRWIRDAGLRQAGNLPIQSLAAGQFKLGLAKTEAALLELLDSGIWCWPLVPVHDQGINEVQEEYADVVGEIQSNCFSECMRDEQTGEHLFRVPIDSDLEIMDVWKKG
jgi:DNA polymerase-1